MMTLRTPPTILLLFISTWAAQGDTFQYDASGRLHEAIQGNGVVLEYSLDAEANVLGATFSATDTTDLGGPGNGMADWWEQYYFDERGIDPQTRDDDGVPVLMKFALGLEPGEDATGGLPELSIGEDTASLTFRKSKLAGNLDYVVESSTDLVDWTLWAEETEALFNEPPVAGLGDDLANVYRLEIPHTGDRLFLRLRVSKP